MYTDFEMKVEPKQKRSILTKSKIKDTAKKLFIEQGYYNVTSNMIAKVAKIPIGSFYNYFGNKKGVLLELIRESNNEFHDETINKFLKMEFEINSSSEVFDFIHYSLVNTLLANYLSDPFYKVIHALQFTEEDVLKLSDEIRYKEIEVIIVFLNKVSKLHPLKDIPLGAKLIHSTIENVGLYIHLLGANVDNERLIGEAVKMIYSYIFSD